MTTQICAKCGNPVPANAPAGICPQCLLKAGLDTEFSSGETARSLTLEPELRPEAIARDFPALEDFELLGCGGMGVVYKARQPALDRTVALKLLSSRFKDDPAFAERFQREARALARLSHPNIVGVFDFGQTNGRYYLIMEYVDGINMREALQDGHFSPEEALSIVPHICEALQYAHEEKVVHRDIKPENILLDKRGRVKIADFGLVKILDPNKRDFTLTGVREVMGTPQYMAPEQLGRATAVDHRADIYALGVVFYEMLTGELPVGRFAPPSRKVTVDVRIDEIVLRTLENEPSLRYQNARDIKTDISGMSAVGPQPVSEAGRTHRTVSPPGTAADLATVRKQLLFPASFILLAGIANSTATLPLILAWLGFLKAVPVEGYLFFMSTALFGFGLIHGAVQLMFLRKRRTALVTCVVAMLPLHPAVFISFIPGLVGLIRLTRSEVEAAFDYAKRGEKTQ